MTSTIYVGSVVALKSGGPLMTVKDNIPEHRATDRGTERGVYCCWIDETGIPHTEVYREAMLRVKREETDDAA